MLTGAAFFCDREEGLIPQPSGQRRQALMFTITTTTPGPVENRGGMTIDWSNLRSTARHTVDTLEEVHDIIREHIRANGMECAENERDLLLKVTEEGGKVSFPDGTVIEVKP